MSVERSEAVNVVVIDVLDKYFDRNLKEKTLRDLFRELINIKSVIDRPDDEDSERYEDLFKELLGAGVERSSMSKNFEVWFSKKIIEFFGSKEVYQDLMMEVERAFHAIVKIKPDGSAVLLHINTYQDHNFIIGQLIARNNISIRDNRENVRALFMALVESNARVMLVRE